MPKAEVGRWVVEHLRRRGLRQVRVLILASHEHVGPQDRCAETVRADLDATTVTVDDICDFSRSRAQREPGPHPLDLDAAGSAGGRSHDRS
ncbi:hypothetical protein [Umezawaea tangerina]|uniref:hypothetical protein n=1 Tax=Umezawaea tangerina TaxID=84725 RepID=UPI0011B27D41|nr:hypothetical protein [Umezawaea tangerina]